MAQHIQFSMNKTYATYDNAVKAAQKKYGTREELRFVIMRDEPTGRYFPLFIGMNAVSAGVHFNFHVAA